jgi:predicted Zn-dependent peptidase
MLPLLYGEGHPYAASAGSGYAEAIEGLTGDDISAAHARWLRPDLATITVVGDVEMDEILPLLDEAFGKWPTPRSATPVKQLDLAIPPASERIVVVDRPNSPQSVIVFGRILPLKGTDAGQEPLELANEIVGGSFLSRLNTELREEKGWSYGVRSQISSTKGPEAFLVTAPVQADKTGEAIALALEEIDAFPATRPVDDVELQRVTDGNIRGMPNRYQTNGQVLSALVTNERYGRPDDYQAQLPDIYRAIDAAAIDEAARTYLHSDGLTIVVVGDRTIIDEQLVTLGLPIEYAEVAADVE